MAFAHLRDNLWDCRLAVSNKKKSFVPNSRTDRQTGGGYHLLAEQDSCKWQILLMARCSDSWMATTN